MPTPLAATAWWPAWMQASAMQSLHRGAKARANARPRAGRQAVLRWSSLASSRWSPGGDCVRGVAAEAARSWLAALPLSRLRALAP
jgi:hypothetical protein